MYYLSIFRGKIYTFLWEYICVFYWIILILSILFLIYKYRLYFVNKIKNAEINIKNLPKSKDWIVCYVLEWTKERQYMGYMYVCIEI